MNRCDHSKKDRCTYMRDVVKTEIVCDGFDCECVGYHHDEFDGVTIRQALPEEFLGCELCQREGADYRGPYFIATYLDTVTREIFTVGVCAEHRPLHRYLLEEKRFKDGCK